MKVSHIIIKVKNLQQAVEEWQSRGFAVEYGSAKNPFNALIYFSDGPYLEIFSSTGMPAAAKTMLRLFGKGKLTDRVNHWDNHAPGPCGLALEKYETNLNPEKELLRRAGQRWVHISARRNDPHGRTLRFSCLFPDDLRIPFLMTYFNIDPKPKNFVHPNGARRVHSVSFGTKAEYIPLIRSLCSEESLVLFPGNGIRDILLEDKDGKIRPLSDAAAL